MDRLRQKISELFNNSFPTIEEVLQSPKCSETSEAGKPFPPDPIGTSNEKPEKRSDSSRGKTEPITSADLPTPDLSLQQFQEQKSPSINYEFEFVDFVDRNAPRGMSKKLLEMLPYLEVSFLSWPAFWFWRGYNWHAQRKTERIAIYIQRTYQQAKLMQLAILAAGLCTVSMGHSAGMPIQVQKVNQEEPKADDTDIGDSSLPK
ncbi:uncharacterized protein LOC108099007 [Drosophila ficusphila]|uniref:uncharacterized protein LOC108099007 n=1 Tax=Drosophila ficusphila TaxID=30025 RepID=UPI0007E5F927|nr:uncharacterized protein LOC108099007 [Drosophila ficusphila]